MSKPNHRHPKTTVPVTNRGKVARDNGAADNIARAKFSWRSAFVDFDGPFGFSKADVTMLFQETIPRLHDFETMTWGEIDGKTGSHFVAVSDLCKEARERLVALIQADLEELYSVRITGARRVWGIREGATLRLLWWDPEHAVCPSPKKRT
jgi:hypothetical protein